ncbi:hypothetical protein [Mycobacterium sp. SM1]|nr:hypothetical protein [Mycobacterium sp. SM1]
MANNRYLEVIKRLLSAETYLRMREKANERKPQQPGPEQKPR